MSHYGKEAVCAILLHHTSLWRDANARFTKQKFLCINGGNKFVGRLKAWHCHVVRLVCKSKLLQGLSRKLVPLHSSELSCSRTIWRSHCLCWPFYVLVPINVIPFIRMYNKQYQGLRISCEWDICCSICIQSFKYSRTFKYCLSAKCGKWFIGEDWHCVSIVN